MINDMIMKKVNVFEVKAKLSEYLDLVENGEQVVICRRNRPVAELRPVAGLPSTDRPLGGLRFEVPQTFFDPLPSDIEDAFYGGPAAGPASRVAGRRSPSRAPGRTTRRKKG